MLTYPATQLSFLVFFQASGGQRERAPQARRAKQHLPSRVTRLPLTLASHLNSLAWRWSPHFGFHSFLPIRTSCPRRVYYISCRVFQTFHAVFGWKIINDCFQLLQNLYFMLRVVFVRVSARHRSRPPLLLLTLSLPEVINMFPLSILSILYPSNRS